MATAADLAQWYKTILESTGLQVDEAGNASMMLGEQAFPCTVNEKRLVVPIPDLLRSGGWDADRVAFHPLSENVARSGESPVLKKFRALANHRLTEVISTLMTELMEIAADPDHHAKLTPRQSEYLSHVKNADAKALAGLIKVLESVSTTGPRRIVSTYLKKGGKLRGQSYSRLAVVSFPIAEEFDEDSKSIFNITLDRKKDVQTIEALFNYIVPDAHDLEAYSYGSNSMVAPYFHALCHAYANVAKRLNSVTRRFRKHLDNPDGLLIDLDWVEQLDDLAQFRDLIPPLNGNDGGIGEGDEAPAQAQATAQASRPATAALREKYAREVVDTTTVRQPERGDEHPATASAGTEMPATSGPATASGSGGMDWNELVAKSPVLSRTVQPPMPAFPQAQPFPRPTGYLQQPMAMQGYQQPPVHGFVQQPANAQRDWRDQIRSQPTRGGYGGTAPVVPPNTRQYWGGWPSGGGGFGGGRV